MDLERHFHETSTDEQLLRFLTSPQRPALPPPVDRADDPLGLIEFIDPRAAAAAQIFFGFSYISAKIAESNPTVRAQLRTAGRTVEFPIVQVGNFHRYGLRRYDDLDGASTYEFYPAHHGSPDGGFFAIKNANGSCVLRKDMESELQGEEYDQILGEAQRAMLVYAKKVSILPQQLQSMATQDHLDVRAVRSLAEQSKKEQKLHYRVMKSMGTAVCRVYNSTYGFFTKEADITGRRRPALARIAMAAALMPLPGYGEPMFGTPIPRPVALEAAADSGSFAIAVLTPDKEPDLDTPYNALQLDLPDDTRLAFNMTQPVALVHQVPGAADHRPIDFAQGGVLFGTSPRRVILRQDLPPNQCQRLSINPEIQDHSLYMATTSQRITGKVTVEAAQTAVWVCNQTSQFINNEELDLVFDSRPTRQPD